MAFHLVRRSVRAARSAVIAFTSTPARGRTGRPAGAQFPGVTVSASPTARTIRTPVSTHEVGAGDRPRHRKEPAMMLKDKVAVIYGAGGAIGGAVARGFAAEGARLFLTGRHRAPVEAVAKDIVSADGSAEVAEVDVLDEQAVDRYLRYVAGQAGRIDVSFDAIGIPGSQILGVPATDLDAEAFSLPITTYTTSYFVTARLAARHMIPNQTGVIMTVTAFPARKGTPLNGGYG